MVEAVDTGPLRAHVRLLGDMLGKIIRENAGEALFERVTEAEPMPHKTVIWEALITARILGEQSFDYRWLCQFLNLANIADQQHTTSVHTEAHFSQRHPSEHTPALQRKQKIPIFRTRLRIIRPVRPRTPLKSTQDIDSQTPCAE